MGTPSQSYGTSHYVNSCTFTQSLLNSDGVVLMAHFHFMAPHHGVTFERLHIMLIYASRTSHGVMCRAVNSYDVERSAFVEGFGEESTRTDVSTPNEESTRR